MSAMDIFTTNSSQTESEQWISISDMMSGFNDNFFIYCNFIYKACFK